MSNLLTSRRILRPFRPDQISGLFYWVDASDPSTMTLDGTGKISELRSKHGSQYSFTQGTQSLRPSLGGVAPNGKPTIKFTRSAQTRLDSTDIVTGGQAVPQMSMIFVTNWLLYGTLTADIQALIDNNHSVTGFVIQDRPDLNPKSLSGLGTLSATAPLDGTWKIYAATGMGRAPSTIYVNGTRDILAAPWTSTFKTGGVRIGGCIALNRFFNGELAELLWFHKALSHSEIALATEYLKSKWGIS